jgi:hypothetical protein
MLTLLLVTGLLFSVVSLVLSSWPKYSHVNSITCDRVVVFSFYSITPVSSTNKNGRHDIAEILLKVALNIIAITLNPPL